MSSIYLFIIADEVTNTTQTHTYNCNALSLNLTEGVKPNNIDIVNLAKPYEFKIWFLDLVFRYFYLKPLKLEKL